MNPIKVYRIYIGFDNSWEEYGVCKFQNVYSKGDNLIWGGQKYIVSDIENHEIDELFLIAVK